MPCNYPVKRSAERHVLEGRIVTYRRNSCGQIHVFAELYGTLFQRALKVDVGNLFTQVQLLPDQYDEAVFDLDFDICALLDGFGECTVGDDGESLATTNKDISLLDLMTWKRKKTFQERAWEVLFGG